MPYAYRFVIQRLNATPLDGAACDLAFDATNHDEIIELVDRVKSARILPDDEAAACLVGLKLFSEVMLRHREEPLFADLFPHFSLFMKRLKTAAARTTKA